MKGSPVPDAPVVEFESRMLIDGKLVDGESGMFTNVNPATEEVIGEVADASRATCIAPLTREGSASMAELRMAQMSLRGFKDSGVGRQNGLAGFEQYLEVKSVAWPAG